jgi:hypothetical protein
LASGHKKSAVLGLQKVHAGQLKAFTREKIQQSAIAVGKRMNAPGIDANTVSLEQYIKNCTTVIPSEEKVHIVAQLNKICDGIEDQGAVTATSSTSAKFA